MCSINSSDQVWCIGTYPNGHPKDNESAGHIGVGLVKITETEVPIDANMVFSVVNKRGIKVKSKTFDRIKYDRQFEMKMMGYMIYRFISHTDLRGNPDLTPDDTLTIMCELTIKEGGVLLVGSESKGSMPLPGGNEEESTRNYMEEVFKAGKFTDVSIVCQGKEFPCHKAILAGRSSVFEAMFSPNFKEGMENKVEVVDVTADVIEEMLRFIYSGRVKDLKKMAASLLAAAEKYNLKGLKKLSEQSLCVNMNVGNVLDMMELADLHTASNLRATALKFVGENAKEVASQQEWRERMPDVMADIIDAMIQK